MSFNQEPTATIVAQATPPGRGGIGVIRVSGPLAQTIAEKILKQCPPPRVARHLVFYDEQQQPMDEGIALFFKSPNSFTGEDVLELQGHGGPVVMDCIIKQVLSYGARLANPGEFSERAFINGKCDLAQAEAIADLINSNSIQAARSAVRSLAGEFSNVVNTIKEKLIYVRTYIEAALDFPDEEINLLQDEILLNKTKEIQEELKRVQSKAKQGVLLQEGIYCVIAGKPNVGKSSLLNVLTQQQTAIVSDVAGTTRDVIKDHIQISGLSIHVVDTAGLRKNDDPIEQEGMKRAFNELSQADVIVLVVDASHFEQDLEDEYYQKILNESGDVPVVIVKNKIDLTEENATRKEEQDYVLVSLSVKTGEGINLFKNTLVEQVGHQNLSEDSFIARRRHLTALQQTEQNVQQALQQLHQGFSEISAEHLRQAQQSLSTITGEFSSNDLLGEIFSSFCIGK